MIIRVVTGLDNTLGCTGRARAAACGSLALNHNEATGSLLFACSRILLHLPGELLDGDKSSRSLPHITHSESKWTVSLYIAWIPGLPFNGPLLRH